MPLITTTRHRRRDVSKRLRSARGAIDLASIMVGVLVIGIVGGVAAATVFSVIPWSQNEAAKGNVAAVFVAEGVAKVKDGAFQSSADLVTNKHLQPSTSVAALTGEDDACYVGISKSAAGPLYFGTSAGADIEVLTRSTVIDCVTAAELDDAVESIGGWDGLALPTIETSRLPGAQKGVAYEATIEFTSEGDTELTAGPGLPAGLALDRDTGVISGTATANGSYTFAVEVKNGAGTVSKTLSLDVGLVAPQILTGTLPAATRGVPYSATIEFTGESTTLKRTLGTELPAGLELNEDTGAITGTPTAVGTVEFTVIALNTGGSVVQALSIDVGLDAPVITRGALPGGQKNVAYSQALTWTGDVALFSEGLGELPDGLTVDPTTGVVSGTPTKLGTFDFSITAMNTGGTSTVAYQVKIVDIAPTITTGILPDATKGAAYSAALAGTGDSVVYSTSLGSPPAGITINPTTGVLSGTPTGSGVSMFTVTKMNTGGSVAVALSIDVKLVVPTITTGVLPDATKGAAYSAPLAGTGEGVVYTTSLGSPPAGITINPTTGVLSGTPTGSGESAFTVTKMNTGGSVAVALSIDVKLVAPTITTGVLPDATKGAAYSAALAGTGEGVVYSTSLGSPPAGVTINPATGVLSGTPTGSGVSTFTVFKANTGGSVSVALSIDVKLVKPTITTGVLPDATKGAAYSAALAGTGEGVVYSTSLGSPPAGITINPTTGVLSGTPTGSGESTFTVTKMNTGGSVAVALSIDVKLVKPTITTGILPDATKGAAYSVALAGTGEGVVYSTSLGSPPAGITINPTTGVLSGTPTGSGVSTFTVFKQNTGGSVSVALSIDVLVAAPVVSTASLPSGIPGVGYSSTLAATSDGGVTWSASGLPAGLAVNASTGVISGTPSAAGTASVQVTAANVVGGRTASKTLSLAVNASLPVITTASAPSGAAGGSYSFQVAATGTPAPTFSLASGSLPSGLSLTSTGIIYGTPTTGSSAAFTVRATNASGYDDASLSVSIPYPSITTVSTPTTFVGVPASYSVAVSNFSGATWSAAGLPGGVSINATTGVVSGTPTTSVHGFATFTASKGGATTSRQIVVRSVAETIIDYNAWTSTTVLPLSATPANVRVINIPGTVTTMSACTSTGKSVTPPAGITRDGARYYGQRTDVSALAPLCVGNDAAVWKNYRMQ